MNEIVEIKKCRKPHKCDGCGQTIYKGSSYFRYKLFEDGEFCLEKACIHCHKLCEQFLELECEILPPSEIHTID